MGVILNSFPLTGRTTRDEDVKYLNAELLRTKNQFPEETFREVHRMMIDMYPSRVYIDDRFENAESNEEKENEGQPQCRPLGPDLQESLSSSDSSLFHFIVPVKKESLQDENAGRSQEGNSKDRNADASASARRRRRRHSESVEQFGMQQAMFASQFDGMYAFQTHLPGEECFKPINFTDAMRTVVEFGLTGISGIASRDRKRRSLVLHEDQCGVVQQGEFCIFAKVAKGKLYENFLLLPMHYCNWQIHLGVTPFTRKQDCARLNKHLGILEELTECTTIEGYQQMVEEWPSRVYRQIAYCNWQKEQLLREKYGIALRPGELLANFGDFTSPSSSSESEEF